MRKSCFSIIAGIFILFGLTSSAYGQSEDVVREVVKIKGSIIFDGKPDEEAWRELEPFPFIMYQPHNGQQPSEQTDARIGFDDNYLYVGACLYYKDPARIQAIGKKRDYSNQTCDWFGIHLDTYNDNQNALVFYTNPNAVRFDASVMNNVKTFDRDVNMDWNTYWEVKTLIDSLGWYAEFKIPLSSLRFQAKNGHTIMGLILGRFIPGKNELVIFPDIPPEYYMGTWKPYLSEDIIF
ncbi:MAG: carbohydrate binding family 9 domain-containing protein, partial [Bacteroidales bacterium]|nr:carbohydrate binding family 9 domain-containing protein [Bacteroidales bacterium]